MKAQYDKKKHPAIKYQVGDKVWLDTTNLNLPQPKKKLDDKQTGPLCDYRKERSLSIHAQTPCQLAYSSNIQRSTPYPYAPPAFPNQEQPPPPPPDLIDGDEPPGSVRSEFADFPY